MSNGAEAEEMPAQERRISKELLAHSMAQWEHTVPAAKPAAGLNLLSETNTKLAIRNRTEYSRIDRSTARKPWSCSILTLATATCAILLLATIARSFLTRQLDPKGCGMSYMRPSFAHFPDFDTEHTRFASKYSLYLYREGGIDEDIRVKGVPVIFIPGNAGSYKQVRPIAAEAANYFQADLREQHNGAEKRPLDFFTVDFNEELTAFHGQTLLDQAEYLNEAVAYILALYHSPHRSLRDPRLPEPKSVIILGHSMGGMVARTMVHMPNYQEHTINTIITLSAPHARAPISNDANMKSAYDDINTYWRQSYSSPVAEDNPLADVTLVSVAGGGLDTMVPSEYSSLTSLVPDTHGFTVFTSAIPHVWTGMDHLAIMWCDQFRKALVKAIFDVVDVKRASQTLEQSARIKALRKRLLTGMEAVVDSIAPYHSPMTRVVLDDNSFTTMGLGDRLAIHSLGEVAVKSISIMPIPTYSLGEGSKFTLLTDQKLHSEEVNGTIEVLLCNTPLASGYPGLHDLDTTTDTDYTLLFCNNAAADVVSLPASNRDSVNAFDGSTPFSYLQYSLDHLADYQFVVVSDKSGKPSPGWVRAEFIAGAEASIKVSRGHHQLLMNGLQLHVPAGRSLMTEFKIPEVHSTLFAYRLGMSRQPCGHIDESFSPLLRQYIQEPYESKYFVNTHGGNINVHGISSYMPPPLVSGKGASEGLSLQIWTDPICNSAVDISLEVDVLGSAGKLVMRYRTAFAALPLLVIAIVLRKQFKVYDATGIFMSFAHSMDMCIRTSLPAIFAALTFLAIAMSKAAQGPWVRSLFGANSGVSEQAVDFTANDLMLGTSDPFFWFLVPLFGVISVGVIIVANYFVLAVTHILAFSYGWLRYWTMRTHGQSAVGFASTSMQRRVVTTSILLLLVATMIPYQFAYMIICIIQIATCVRSLDIARSNNNPASTAASIDVTGHDYNFYNYTHSMLILLLWILPINMPVLVVWIHNLAVLWLTPFSPWDNLLAVAPLILAVEGMSRGILITRATGRTRYLTNVMLFAAALYAAIYGVTYAYRLHHLVNALCAWLVVLQLVNGGRDVHVVESKRAAHATEPGRDVKSHHVTPTTPVAARVLRSHGKKRP